jgi:hypothetical protein
MLAVIALGLLVTGCVSRGNTGSGYPPYNGYGLSGGPGGMGSAQGPMPYGDIPGYAPPGGR